MVRNILNILTTKARKPTIFIAYARNDVSLMKRLKRFLVPLENAGLLDVMAQDEVGSEDKIPASSLKTADVILLLVSPDFLNSDYCYRDEICDALVRHKIGKAQIVPVILRSVYWKDTLFSDLQMVPKDTQPITTRDDQEEAFLEVVGAILKAAIAVSLQDSHTNTGIKVFEHQIDAYHFLLNMVDLDDVKEAIFLQLSYQTSLSILRMLLRKGAKVTIFIQHEDTSAILGSQFQADRIINTIRNLRAELGDTLSKPDKLKVYKYRAPSSVSAIKIDNRVLCMGWYTYEQRDHIGHNSYPSDTIDISDHDRAAVVVYKGTDEFQALDKTFRLLERNYRQHAEIVSI